MQGWGLEEEDIGNGREGLKERKLLVSQELPLPRIHMTSTNDMPACVFINATVTCPSSHIWKIGEINIQTQVYQAPKIAVSSWEATSDLCS